MTPSSELQAIVALFVETPDARCADKELEPLREKKLDAVRSLAHMRLDKALGRAVICDALARDQSPNGNDVRWRLEAWKLLIEAYATSREVIGFAHEMLASTNRATRLEVSAALRDYETLPGKTELLVEHIVDPATDDAEAAETLRNLANWYGRNAGRHMPVALQLARTGRLSVRAVAVDFLLQFYDLAPGTIDVAMALHADAPKLFDRQHYEKIAKATQPSPKMTAFWLAALDAHPGDIRLLSNIAESHIAADPRFAEWLRAAIEPSMDSTDRLDAIERLGRRFYKHRETEAFLLSRFKQADTSAERLAALYWLIVRYLNRAHVVDSIVSDWQIADGDLHGKLGLCIGGAPGCWRGNQETPEKRILERQSVFVFLSRSDVRERLIEVVARDPNSPSAALIRSVVAKHRLQPNMALERFQTRKLERDEQPRGMTDEEVYAKATVTQKLALKLIWQVEAIERLLFPAPKIQDGPTLVEEVVHVSPEAAARWLKLLADLSERLPPERTVPLDVAPARSLDDLGAAFARSNDTDRIPLMTAILQDADKRCVSASVKRLLIEHSWVPSQGHGRDGIDYHDAYGWRAVAWAGLRRVTSTDDIVGFVEGVMARYPRTASDQDLKKRGEALVELTRHWPKERAVLDALMRWKEHGYALHHFGDDPDIRPYLQTILEQSPSRRAFEMACGHFHANAALRPAAERLVGVCGADLELAHIGAYLKAVPADSAAEQTLRTYIDVQIARGLTGDYEAAHALQYYLCRFAERDGAERLALDAARSRLPRLRQAGLGLLGWFFPQSRETVPLLLNELTSGASIDSRVKAFYALMIGCGEQREVRLRLRAALRDDTAEDARAWMAHLLRGDQRARLFETGDTLSDQFRRAEDRKYEAAVTLLR